MKIAIPTRGKFVDDHFGHCEYYTIYTVNEENQIVQEEQYNAQGDCGCRSGISATLKEQGVSVMLAGNMGQGALNKLHEAGIRVYRGCFGEVKKLAESFLKDEVRDSGASCQQHQHHQHEHGHNCRH